MHHQRRLPTEIRAKGIGWAYGVGRFGSMIGPLWRMVGRDKLPISQLFLVRSCLSPWERLLSFKC